MKSEDQNLLQARCQHCRRPFKFKASDYRLTAPCPFCKEPTPLQVDSTPAIPPQRINLPQWVLPAVTLLAITLIITALLYKSTLDFFSGYEMAGMATVPRFKLFAYCVVTSAISVLGVAFFIYFFNWLRETRMLLRQIETNTRTPVPPRYALDLRTEPGLSTPPRPQPAPEDAKYMPKSL